MITPDCLCVDLWIVGNLEMLALSGTARMSHDDDLYHQVHLINA